MRNVTAQQRADRSAWKWPRRPATALAWILLAGLLVLSLVGSAFLASRLLDTAPPTLTPSPGTALVPTGVEVLSADGGRYRTSVVDGLGLIWTHGIGRLVRFDPATRSALTWTIQDDAAFATTNIAPASGGGVWLLSAETLRWFDGSAFRAEITAPPGARLVMEGPDGTLWVATDWTDNAVLHWDGSSWTKHDPPASDTEAWISRLYVDAAGQAWVGWERYLSESESLGWVSRFDGDSWTTYDGYDAAPLGAAVTSITQLRDGAVWVATRSGLARFDGVSWTDTTELPLVPWTSLSAAPDGTLWAASAGPGVTLGRFDGRAWVSYGARDGLPGGSNRWDETATVLPTDAGVHVSTGAGIYELSSGQWSRVWPADPPVEWNTLLAVSRNELWATGNSRLWHFVDGAWTNDPIDPGHPSYAPRTLTLAPDGTIWAAGLAGVAYRRDGRWAIADSASEPRAVAVAADGTAWVTGRTGESGRLWTLREVGTEWIREEVAGFPLVGLGGPSDSIGIDAAGAVWVGTSYGGVPGGLVRFDGRAWETIDEIAGTRLDGSVYLGTGPDAVVWIEMQTTVGATQDDVSGFRSIFARFDGSRWTVVQAPDSYIWWPRPALAPDGTLWANSDRGPLHFDGSDWTYPYEWAAKLMVTASAAPDGTVFAGLGWNVSESEIIIRIASGDE